MSRGEKNTLLVFIIIAFAWIFEKTKIIGGIVIPGLDILFPAIDDSTVAIFGALVLFIIPADLKKGIFTMNWKWAVQIPWGILILFGGGLSLSTAFIKSGLAEQIVRAVSVLQGLPAILIVLLIAIAVSLLTEVTSNTAIASILMPVMAVSSVAFGFHPFLFMLTAAICTSLAFMLPVATPPNAIAFGTEYVNMPQMVKAGWGLNFLGITVWTIFLFTIVMAVLDVGIGLPVWAVP